MTHDIEATITPHAIESERELLGALLLKPDAFDRVDWLPEAAFFREAHRTIYRGIRALLEAGRGVDPLLLADHLRTTRELDKVGGQEYIGSLMLEVHSAAHVKRHAEIIQEQSIRRQLMAHAIELAGKAADPSEDARALAEAAEDSFLSVLDAGSTAELIPFHRAVSAAVDWLDEPESGLSTGYAELDRVWGGMRPADLIVIAGRPSMGKSALAFNIAEHVSAGAPVLVFSLEMTSRALAARSFKYHRSLVGASKAVTHLMDRSIWIDESPAIGVGYVRARAKRLKRSHGLGLIVVDYLQLMTGKGENRTQEVASISRGLKAIAKEFQVPVIAVSQLSRGVESRTDRRPVISDLRESGQVEQDADIIAFVYREEYYTPETPLVGIAEVLTRKHREGATGNTYLAFEASYARFKNLEGPVPEISGAAPRGRKAGAGVFDFKSKQSGEAA